MTVVISQRTCIVDALDGGELLRTQYYAIMTTYYGYLHYKNENMCEEAKEVPVAWQ